jgi:type IV pilus assembly protein PilC
MLYPACMLGFCVLAITGLMVFILPRVEKIYAGKAALPVPTQVLIGISHFMTGYWYLILAALIGAVVGAYYYFRTPGGRVVLDNIKISVPVLGPMYRKACLARSLRTMATMVSSGVDMLDALDITAKVAGNDSYSRIWRHLSGRVQEGAGLSDELLTFKLVPRTLTQMMASGEKTGRLGEVMERVAKFCEDDLNVSIKSVITLIDPALLILLGVLVVGNAMALLLPVFSMSKVVAH